MGNDQSANEGSRCISEITGGVACRRGKCRGRLGKTHHAYLHPGHHSEGGSAPEHDGQHSSHRMIDGNGEDGQDNGSREVDAQNGGQ